MAQQLHQRGVVATRADHPQHGAHLRGARGISGPCDRCQAGHAERCQRRLGACVQGGPWWREVAGWLGEMRRLITHLDGQADKVRVDQLGLGRADGADLHGRAQRRCWRPAVGLRQQ